MQQSKGYDDALALADAPIGETFLIIHILDGLNSEFKKIVAAVKACETSITFEELHDKLLSHKGYLKRESLKQNNNNITTNVTTKQNPNTHFVAQSNGFKTDWLMDSSASHHVTFDLQNLSLRSKHDGSDNIVIEFGICFLNFCQSSHISIEFLLFSFVVKDLRTVAPLVTRCNRDGAYD
ncbi:hypothetical protein AAG906_035280 [Vitis piasezkii]